MKREYVAMIGVALVASAGVARAEPDPKTAILELIAAEDAAWKAGDAAKFCEAALPNVVFTNIVGMFSVGQEPMRRQHERIFSTIYKGSTVHQSLANLEMIGSDVAIVDTLTRVTDFKSLPPGAEAIDGALTTRLEQVMVHQGGRWRVASFHNVTVNPAATAGAPK